MIDMVLLVVIGVSALLGLIRGFVGIVVGTASWLLSGWAAFQFGDDTAAWLAEGQRPSMTQYLGGYALTFVAVLVVVAVLGMVIRAGVEATRLSGTDRALGFGLGVVRGMFFACVLVLLMGFTPLPREPAWQQSSVLPVLQPGAQWMRAQLPEWHPPRIDMDRIAGMDLGKLPIAGDNGALGNELSGQKLQQFMSQALEQAKGGNAAAGTGSAKPDPALPTPIHDPAQVRPGEPDPARVERNGQARPPSQ